MKIIVAGHFCQRYRTDSLIRNKAYNLLLKDNKTYRGTCRYKHS